MLDHQSSKALPINKNHALRRVLHKFGRSVSKIAGGYKDPFAGMITGKRANETLNLGPTDSVLPAFRLDINPVQSKPVLIYETVNAPVVRFLRNRRGFLPRSSVAHG